jgi:hypothetical protein
MNMHANEYDHGPFCEQIRNINNQLDLEEHLKNSNKSYRESLYQQELLNNQLVETYTITTLSLIKIDSKLTKKKFDFSLLETHIEVCKLIVDLTCPYEKLYVNRRLILDTLKKVFKHLEKKNETNNSKSESPHNRAKKRPLYDNDQYIQRLIDANITKFKDTFIKKNHFDELMSSLNKMIDLYVNVCGQLDKIGENTATKNESETNELLKLKDLILIDLVLTLCLIRNLVLEKSESRLSQVIWNFLERKIETNFIKLLNLVNLSDFENNLSEEKNNNSNNSIWFVFNSLMCEILTLFFSAFKPKAKELVNSQDFKCTDLLCTVGVSLCRHGAFANLIENMLYLLNKSSELHAYIDISYFLWLLKFMLGNIVLDKSKSIAKRDKNSEKSPEGFLEFFNNQESPNATKLKKIIFSYDLLSFVTFSMLHNFEQLIFDSNLKNMARSMRYYHINQRSEEVCHYLNLKRLFVTKIFVEI